MTGKTSKSWLADTIRRNMPTREALEGNRWTRHLAVRHELWRFTRRSVPRGVAVGLLVGIFALIPGIQIVGAALLCVPARGNIPIAAAMTFLSNPATTPLILIASAMIGNFLGFHADTTTVWAMVESGASLQVWTAWFFSDAAPAVLLGLAVLSVVAAALGYVLAGLIWRPIVARRRQQRLHAALVRRHVHEAAQAGAAASAAAPAPSAERPAEPAAPPPGKPSDCTA
ncbi:MAG: DUF2062 domain-containing protein [Altererythrobacter sp.]|nr:DUF2062 domain-containing protein [Altererythrobacter sp.]